MSEIKKNSKFLKNNSFKDKIKSSLYENGSIKIDQRNLSLKKITIQNDNNTLGNKSIRIDNSAVKEPPYTQLPPPPPPDEKPPPPPLPTLPPLPLPLFNEEDVVDSDSSASSPPQQPFLPPRRKGIKDLPLPPGINEEDIIGSPEGESELQLMTPPRGTPNLKRPK